MKGPSLATVCGWQEDRRRAVLILTDLIKRAEARFDWPQVDGLRAARFDVLLTLRERAEAAIAESVQMRWAHEQLREAA